MKIVNLTPHDIVVATEDAPATMSREDARAVARDIYPASGDLARVKPFSTPSPIPGFHHTVVKTEYGEIEGLPDSQPNTLYIISVVVRLALEKRGIQRSDCITPDTFPPSRVEDEDGNIVGVKRFQR